MSAPDLMVPPHALASEQSLLGALLLDNAAYDHIAGAVLAQDFYRDEHRRIFRHIAALIEQGKAADVVTVFESLEKSAEAAEVGGLAYLGELANTTPSAANIRRYADSVRDRATLRALLAAGCDIQGMALAADGGATEARVAAAAERILAIAEGAIRTRSEPVPLCDCLNDALGALDDAREGKTPTRYQTGLHALDAMLSDYAPGAFVVLAGRPAMGKTSLALALAEACSADARPGAVAVFSLEMPKRQVTFRLLARLTGIAVAALINGEGLAKADFESIAQASGALYARNLLIDETPAIGVADIRARCNVIRRRHGGLKLIVVDYLQLMSGEGENRTQEIGSISRGLKRLAKDFSVPVVALSQLNRSLEQRANKRPLISDLRESGDIEQDADLILFCYRDEVYNPASLDRGTAEIIIGKQRNGAIGECRVAWIGPAATFDNLDAREWMARRAVEMPMRRARRGGME